MSIFRVGGLIRTGIKKLVPLVGLLALGASQHAAAVNLIDPHEYDWGGKQVQNLPSPTNAMALVIFVW